MLNKKYKRFAVLMLTAILLGGVFTGCSKDPQAVAAAKAEGIAALTARDYETAIEKFNEALDAAGSKVGAEEFDICYYKAAAQYAMKDYEGAINTYQRFCRMTARTRTRLIYRDACMRQSRDRTCTVFLR